MYPVNRQNIRPFHYFYNSLDLIKSCPPFTYNNLMPISTSVFWGISNNNFSSYNDMSFFS